MDISRILSYFHQAGFTLSQQEGELFSEFCTLFFEKNKHINLSAVRDEEGIIEKHFVDSCFLSPHLPKVGSILDLGTG